MPVSPLEAALVTGSTVAVSMRSLFYLIMAPKYESSDAENLDMPKILSCKVNE